MFMWHEYSKDVLSNVYEDLDNGIVKLEKLSDTYSYISTEGFNDFYKGDIARSILQTLEQEGGHATANDFSNYDLIEDSKFNYQYKDLKLTGHAGPSIGGLMVLKYLEGLSINSDSNKITIEVEAVDYDQLEELVKLMSTMNIVLSIGSSRRLNNLLVGELNVRTF